MPRKIRSDLVGVVHVHLNGNPVPLTAGDDVPDGATVGDHLLADGNDTTSDDADGMTDASGNGNGNGNGDATEQPKVSASKATWVEYAEKLGVVVPDGATKDDIIDLVGTPEA